MIKIHCKYDELLDPSTLKNHFKNRNRHPDDQIERLGRLYEYHGIRHPIVVSSRSGFIVAGHGRKLAAMYMGVEKVPVVYQSFDSDESEYAFVQADNAIALWADLDLKGINLDMPELGPDFDIDLLGIKGFTLDVAEKEQDPAADQLPTKAKKRAKYGDLFHMGGHRLMCGDATKQQDIQHLMKSEMPDMIFTDPPYGMNLDADYGKTMNVGGKSKISNTHKAQKHENVIGDHQDFTPELITTIFDNFHYCKEIFLFGADYYAEHIEDKNEGSWIVWDKRGSESMDKGYGSCFELCWSKQKHKRDIARIVWTGFLGVKDDSKTRVHPTQKPVQLAEWFFERWGKPDDLVLDLYAGSGSTVIACEKQNRSCFAMELDPVYCDIILARWEQFTNKKAELIT